MKAHIALLAAALAVGASAADQKIAELLAQDREYSVLPGDVFDTFGWDLPDGGRHVKAIADAAPGGAFDPRQLEKIRPADLGYRARWQVVRYKQYGLDWDITGLQLTPVDDGHWNRVPEQAREWNMAQRFRKENPGAPIRILLIDKPITHYAHIEMPKQLAAVLVGAVRWLSDVR